MTKKQEYSQADEDLQPIEETEDSLQDETVENNDTQNEEPEESASSEAEDGIDPKDKEINELRDKYVRLMAEFDNYRKRTIKEKADLIRSANEKTLVDLLPVIDDLELAEKSISQASDVEALKEGVGLIMSKLQAYLKQQGVAEIEAHELEFDVEKHEAVTKFPAPSEELKGKVIDVIKKGYQLHDKIIRFSQVVVGE